MDVMYARQAIYQLNYISSSILFIIYIESYIAQASLELTL